MKKAEFYLNVRDGKGNLNYPKVSGWIEEIEDGKGNKITVGYHKAGQSGWSATEITTGFKCIARNTKTKIECSDWVHKNINIITQALRQSMNGADKERFIVPFMNFVNKNQ